MNVPPIGASTRTPAPQGSCLPAIDEVLNAIRLAQPPPGLEARILTRLQAESASRSRGLGIVFGSNADRFRGWAPIGMAASLACVLAGGLLIERQAPATRPMQGLSAANPSPDVKAIAAQDADAAARQHAFATASARRQPAEAIPAGNRRGRATRLPIMQKTTTDAIAAPARVHPE